MATRINTDGTRVVMKPAHGFAFTLADLQGVVGGYIEAFYLRDGRVMFLNEDGKGEQLPLNIVATLIAYDNGLPPDDAIVGDVIIVTRIEAGEERE